MSKMPINCEFKEKIFYIAMDEVLDSLIILLILYCGHNNMQWKK